MLKKALLDKLKASAEFVAIGTFPEVLQTTIPESVFTVEERIAVIVVRVKE